MGTHQKMSAAQLRQQHNRDRDGRYTEQVHGEAPAPDVAGFDDHPAPRRKSASEELMIAHRSVAAAEKVEKYWAGQALMAEVREHVPDAHHVSFLREGFRHGIHQIRDVDGNLLHDCNDSSGPWVEAVSRDDALRRTVRQTTQTLDSGGFGSYHGADVVFDATGADAPKHVVVPDDDDGYLDGVSTVVYIDDHELSHVASFATEADRDAHLIHNVRMICGANEDDDTVTDPHDPDVTYPMPTTGAEAAMILEEIDGSRGVHIR